MIWVTIYILPICAITIHLSLFTLLLFSLKVMPDSLWPTDCRTPGSSVLLCLLELLKLMPIESVMPSNHLILCPPLFSCSQSFPASGSFPMSRLFSSGGQNVGVSALVLPVNIQSWFPLGMTGLISLTSKGLLRVFSNTTIQKHQFFSAQPSLWSNSLILTWLLYAKALII